MNKYIDYEKIVLDRKSPEPLHLQLYNALVRKIRSLPPNRRVILLSERELAAQLKLSRRTVHRAYEQLIEEHLVCRMPDKSLVVRSDARIRIAGTYPVIGVLVAEDFAGLVERNDQGILPYLKGLISRCSLLNVSCIMLRAPDINSTPKEIEAFAAVHFMRLCGVVHLGDLNLGQSANCSDPVLEQLLQHTEIPQVCISGHVPFPHTGSVYADPAPGLNALCRTLKERGFHRVGVISPTFRTFLFHYVAADRFQTMREAVIRNGLECVYALHADYGEIQSELARLLISPDRPEVLLCHNERIVGMVTEQAEKLGISIPGDLFLAEYDRRRKDSFIAGVCTYPERVAAAAVDMVMDHFWNGITEDNRVKLLPTEFCDGESIIGRRK